MSKKKLIIFLILLVVPLSVGAVLAANAATVSLDNPLKTQGITSLFDSSAYIGKIIGRLLKIIGAVSLLLLVYSGFLMVSSGGSEAKIKEAKNIITYTAIGLVVIFSAYIILTFFLGALGGTIYNEYQDLPAAPAETIVNTEEQATTIESNLVDMEIDVIDHCSDCNVIINCAFQSPECAAKNCCTP